MKSRPISDLRLIDPHAPDDLLTEEQRAFAIVLGRILAEQWEREQPPRIKQVGSPGEVTE